MAGLGLTRHYTCIGYKRVNWRPRTLPPAARTDNEDAKKMKNTADIDSDIHTQGVVTWRME